MKKLCRRHSAERTHFLVTLA